MGSFYSNGLYYNESDGEHIMMIKWLKPEKKISMRKFFQLKNPQYVYLRLTPHTSTRNYNSSSIAMAMHNIQRGISRRIKKEEKCWTYETIEKCSYMIDIYKNEVMFYLIVPKVHVAMAKEKVREVWPRTTIDEVEGVAPFSPDSVKYGLQYKREDGLSLAVDKKSNEPLNYILNVVDIMQDTDRVSVLYNFMPTNQFTWKADYDRTIQKIKDRQPIDRNKCSFEYAYHAALAILSTILETILETAADMGMASEKKKGNDVSVLDLAITTLNLDKDLSQATKKKRESIVLETQLVVVAHSEDKERAKQSAQSVCQSFGSIDGDNELVYKQLRGKEEVKIESYKMMAPVNKMSVLECQNLLQLPGRELLEQFHFIRKIDVLETPVAESLLKGVMRAGENKYLGGTSMVYHTEDVELKNTAICVCGPNRSGKTTLFGNMTYDAVSDGRIVIVPDFCGKGKLSSDLAQVIGPDKTLNIDCGNIDELQGFGWNEIVPLNDTPFELYRAIKDKTARLKELINLVNSGDDDVHGRMERFLEQAALITFACGGSVNDVFRMLKDHVLRHELMNSVPEALLPKLEEHIMELKEIDDIASKGDNKGDVIGTKMGMISAILSRVHRLKENAYVEEMLARSCDDNIDLLDIMKKKGEHGMLITITMPDSMFKTQQQKDTYVCYWLTKIWGALQQRYCETPDENKLKQVVLLIDELYQTKNAELYLTSILSQVPKYRAKFIVSCHHLAQIPTIQEELKSAMCSYMFLRGSNKKNFYAMKEELEDKGFSLEDLLHLQRYQSLNLIAYEDGYWAGITLTPPPVEENKSLPRL